MVSSLSNPYASRSAPTARRGGSDGLADVLERVLDKGLVVAGDIQVNLLDIELLTIKVRLLLASADTAQQMGIDWWTDDPFLTSSGRGLERENAELRERLSRLEELVAGAADQERLPADTNGGRTSSRPGEDGATRADDG